MVNFEYVVEPWSVFISKAGWCWISHSLKHFMVKMSLAAIVHAIWIERNRPCFSNKEKETTVIVDSISNIVRERVVSMSKIKKLAGDDQVKCEWKLPSYIFDGP